MSSWPYCVPNNSASLTAGRAAPAFPFRPLPLLGNPHVQTLLAYWWNGPALRHPARRQRVPLPDGDSLVLHDSAPAGWQPGAPLVVLVHGMTGSSASPLIQRLARRLLRHGLRSVRVDLRGAGHSLPLSRRCYHGGCSDDLRAALETVHAWSPASPLVLVGTSLGGNIALKLAGEAADRPVPGLERVAALAPPIDLGRCVDLLSQPHNRLYEAFFVRELLAQARQRRRHFPDQPIPAFPRRTTIRLYDELYTAPSGGFAGADDYYRRASSLPVLHRLPVPALILTARDDPFIAVEPFEGLRPTPRLRLEIHRHGGHLGFLGWDGRGGFRWAERRLVEWILE